MDRRKAIRRELEDTRRDIGFLDWDIIMQKYEGSDRAIALEIFDGGDLIEDAVHDAAHGVVDVTDSTSTWFPVAPGAFPINVVTTSTPAASPPPSPRGKKGKGKRKLDDVAVPADDVADDAAMVPIDDDTDQYRMAIYETPQELLNEKNKRPNTTIHVGNARGDGKCGVWSFAMSLVYMGVLGRGFVDSLLRMDRATMARSIPIMIARRVLRHTILQDISNDAYREFPVLSEAANELLGSIGREHNNASDITLSDPQKDHVRTYLRRLNLVAHANHDLPFYALQFDSNPNTIVGNRIKKEVGCIRGGTLWDMAFPGGKSDLDNVGMMLAASAFQVRLVVMGTNDTATMESSTWTAMVNAIIDKKPFAHHVESIPWGVMHSVMGGDQWSYYGDEHRGNGTAIIMGTGGHFVPIYINISEIDEPRAQNMIDMFGRIMYNGEKDQHYNAYAWHAMHGQKTPGGLHQEMLQARDGKFGQAMVRPTSLVMMDSLDQQLFASALDQLTTISLL